MPVISKINLIEQPQQHVLSIRTIIQFRDFVKVAGEVYDKIMKFMDQNGLVVASGPFVCYHNADLDNLDVELGFPVAKPMIGDGEIKGYTIPVQKAVSGIFLGAYTDTDPLMMGIMQWIAEHGYSQLEGIYNYYLNDDARPQDELLTQIVVPIK